MITLLILIADMWWFMFTGVHFVHGDLPILAYVGFILAIVEVGAIAIIRMK